MSVAEAVREEEVRPVSGERALSGWGRTRPSRAGVVRAHGAQDVLDALESS